MNDFLHLKVEWYFRLMFLLLVISISSFSFLNYSKTAINARKSGSISSDFSKIKKISPSTVDPFDLKSNANESFNTSKNELIQDLESKHSPIYFSQDDTKEKTILLTYIFCLSFM